MLLPPARVGEQHFSWLTMRRTLQHIDWTGLGAGSVQFSLFRFSFTFKVFIAVTKCVFFMHGAHLDIPLLSPGPGKETDFQYLHYKSQNLSNSFSSWATLMNSTVYKLLEHNEIKIFVKHKHSQIIPAALFGCRLTLWFFECPIYFITYVKLIQPKILHMGDKESLDRCGQ